VGKASGVLITGLMNAQKKMNGRELHTHVRALFKEMTEEDRDKFLKGAEEAGF
jgi:hypothetical protein